MNKKEIIYKIFLIVCFAIAMGFFEAVVVVYLRAIMQELPYITEPIQQVTQKLAKEPLYLIEQFREAATIIMLAAFAILTGKNLWERFANFLLVFGVWDIVYYISLYLVLRWPPSLFTEDVLFLIPVPWKGPVIAPVLVSILMIISAFVILKSKVWDKEV